MCWLELKCDRKFQQVLLFLVKICVVICCTCLKSILKKKNRSMVERYRYHRWYISLVSRRYVPQCDTSLLSIYSLLNIEISVDSIQYPLNIYIIYTRHFVSRILWKFEKKKGGIKSVRYYWKTCRHGLFFN